VTVRPPGAVALGIVLAAGVAGCGGGTTTVTVQTTATAPPPAAATKLSGSKSNGEQGIRRDLHPSAAFHARHAPRFTPAAGCGIERWAVKTLTDPGATAVKLTPRDSTIAALGSIVPPRDPTDRVAPTETTVFRLRDVRMTAFKEEADSDIHLALADSSGRTMIAEFPSPSCDAGAPKGARAMMTAAREDFVAACGEPSDHYKTTNGSATLTGVGFFDRIHGQRGVAANGIELHPVLGFKASSC
jgi:hypothetical protein